MEGNDDVVGPINFGNPGEFTIRQLAEIVVDLAGSSSRIVHRPLPSRRSKAAPSRYQQSTRVARLATQASPCGTG
jgi:nucleoside-diphosphate-sugar epimerase